MKIAVSSQGKDLDSRIDPRFGRASYFLIIDTDDNSFEVLDNGENVQAPQGAGVRSAQIVARKEVDVVVTGNIGPRAFDTLSAAGIKAVTCEEGTIAQAVERVKNEDLKPTDGANVRGHWQ